MHDKDFYVAQEYLHYYTHREVPSGYLTQKEIRKKGKKQQQNNFQATKLDTNETLSHDALKSKRYRKYKTKI